MQTTASQRWLIRAPFGIYYGWITVATIANVSVWLSSIGFNGWGLPSQLWQIIVLLLGGVILCAGVLVNRDILYGITGLWAYAGIMMRQLSLDNTGSSYFWSLTAIFISSVVVIFAIIFVAFACPASKIPIFSRFNRMTFSPDNKDWRKSL